MVSAIEPSPRGGYLLLDEQAHPIHLTFTGFVSPSWPLLAVMSPNTYANRCTNRHMAAGFIDGWKCERLGGQKNSTSILPLIHPFTRSNAPEGGGCWTCLLHFKRMARRRELHCGAAAFLLGGLNGYVLFATRNSALVERYHEIEPFYVVIYTSHAVVPS